MKEYGKPVIENYIKTFFFFQKNNYIRYNYMLQNKNFVVYL